MPPLPRHQLQSAGQWVLCSARAAVRALHSRFLLSYLVQRLHLHLPPTSSDCACTCTQRWQVRRADVDLLLSMPRLKFLSIGVRMAHGVRSALLAAAPRLQLVEP